MFRITDREELLIFRTRYLYCGRHSHCGKVCLGMIKYLHAVGYVGSSDGFPFKKFGMGTGCRDNDFRTPVKTILMSSSDRDLDRGKFSISVGLINAGSLFGYRVMQIYSLDETIQYKFSLYFHCHSWIKRACSS